MKDGKECLGQLLSTLSSKEGEMKFDMDFLHFKRTKAAGFCPTLNPWFEQLHSRVFHGLVLDPRTHSEKYSNVT